MRVCVLLALSCALALTQGAIDLNPEYEALQYVFGDDRFRFQGIHHLKWHEDHLKAVAAILHHLNYIKQAHVHQTYPQVFANRHDEWARYSIMMDNNIWTDQIGLKWDTYHGDKHVLYKLRRYTSIEQNTAHIQKYISRYGNDYLKYYAMDPNFNYTITNAERFSTAQLTFTDPADLMARTGMTEDQLMKYADGFRHMILLHPYHIEIPMLMLELGQEMVPLGIIDQMNDPWHSGESS